MRMATGTQASPPFEAAIVIRQAGIPSKSIGLVSRLAVKHHDRRIHRRADEEARRLAPTAAGRALAAAGAATF
jgi:hypothetical protein